MQRYIEVPSNQNEGLEQTGLAKPGKTSGLRSTRLGLACHNAE